MIKIESKTRYFAIKKAISKAIDIFREKGSINEIELESKYEGGAIELTIKRQTIRDYLGYDFRTRKAWLNNDLKRGGKLYHKAQVLLLYGLILNEMFNINTPDELHLTGDSTGDKPAGILNVVKGF